MFLFLFFLLFIWRRCFFLVLVFFWYHFRVFVVWRVRRTYFPSKWCFSNLRPRARAGLVTSAYYVRIQSINQSIHLCVCVYLSNCTYSRCPGLPASSLPVRPVYRCFFSCHPVTPVYRWYAGIPGWFIFPCSRSPSCYCTLPRATPTHAAAHNTTQHTRCCGQQPTLAYTPCHVRQENYANLVTALPSS